MSFCLYIISELFPPDETSTAYILGEIANTFASKYKVKVICGPEVYDKRKIINVKSGFVLNPAIEVFRVQGTGLDKNTAIGKAVNLFVMSRRLKALAASKIKKGDKVLMVTNPAPLVLLMTRLRDKIGFELNVLVHDVFPENTIPAGVRIPAYNCVKKLFDKAYSKADQLIVLGRDMKHVVGEKIKRLNSSCKITIIENWGDTQTISAMPFPSGKIKLQYAGNIGRVQGLQKVVQQLPEDLELHIYGTGAMEDTLKNMGCRNVFFHGPYSRSQQNEILSDCHIALVTLQDGMYGLGVPSKTYNIMASGRPILYFGPTGSEIDLLIKDAEIGYSDWPDEWSITVLQAMGARARKLVEQRYSKPEILKRFLDTI